MTAPQDPYSYPPAPGAPGGPGGPAPRSGAQLFSIFAMVSGALALLLSPLIFGIIGIILAVVANRRGEPLWKIALGVVVACTVLGIIIGAIVLSNT